MKFGLTDKELSFLKDELVRPMSQLGAKVYVFGSRARGDHQQFSDLDILIEPGEEDIKSSLLLIKEKLEESNFPYKVDIVLFSDLATSYRENVLMDRKLISLK